MAEGNINENICLQNFFRSYDSNREEFAKLKGLDPTVQVLALQSLYEIENKVKSSQLVIKEPVQELLREWRNKYDVNYQDKYSKSKEILKSLTIFKALDVPLFIDNWGKKNIKLLSNQNGIKDIDITKDTPIYHVTHQDEAKQISQEKRLKPSNNKNMIEGTWFGIDNGQSVYGSRAFKTTLGKLESLDVEESELVLRQGEVVTYKKEVNVILYAESALNPYKWVLKKPIVDAPWYVKISIFVPSKFLPKTDDDFAQVFDHDQPLEVEHGPWCLKEKRPPDNEPYNCLELLTGSFNNFNLEEKPKNPSNLKKKYKKTK